MTDDNTPTVQNFHPSIPENEFLKDLQINIPPPILGTQSSDYDETLKADIALYNAKLMVLYALWGEVKTFSMALTLIDKTLPMIKLRRDILGLPYGSSQGKGSAQITWEPIP